MTAEEIARQASSRASAKRSSEALRQLRMIEGKAYSVGEILAISGLSLEQFGQRFRKGYRRWDQLRVVE